MSEYDIIDHILPKVIHQLSTQKDTDPVEAWLQTLFCSIENLPETAITSHVYYCHNIELNATRFFHSLFPEDK